MMKTLTMSSVSDDIRMIISLYPRLVEKVGIFGSVARGDYDNDSDIDILIKYVATKDFKIDLFTQFCELCNKIAETLADMYGRKIDIVHFENESLDILSDKNVITEVIWL